MLTNITEPLEGGVIMGLGVQQDKVIVETTDGLVTIHRKSLYYVENDLSVTSYSRDLLNESSLYNLRDPRPFTPSSLCCIHPFHLPTMRDPLLSVMIITIAVITELL